MFLDFESLTGSVDNQVVTVKSCLIALPCLALPDVIGS